MYMFICVCVLKKVIACVDNYDDNNNKTNGCDADDDDSEVDNDDDEFLYNNKIMVSPVLLCPQQYNSPSDETNTECRNPAATCLIHTGASSLLSGGVINNFVKISYCSPNTFLDPVIYTSPPFNRR